jgi:hypothetical protein
LRRVIVVAMQAVVELDGGLPRPIAWNPSVCAAGADYPDSPQSVRMSQILRVLARVASGVFVVAASGCATITGSSTQTIEVTTADARDRTVRGMTCTLTHGPGSYVVDTPAIDLEIRRSASDLEIECRRGSQIAKGTVVPRAESAIAHSFIPGGSIATLVDYATGAMYTYPSPLRLKIGQHLRFESGSAAKATVVADVGDPPAAASTPRPTTTASNAAAGKPAAVTTTSTPTRPLRRSESTDSAATQ